MRGPQLTIGGGPVGAVRAYAASGGGTRVLGDCPRGAPHGVGLMPLEVGTHLDAALESRTGLPDALPDVRGMTKNAVMQLLSMRVGGNPEQFQPIVQGWGWPTWGKTVEMTASWLLLFQMVLCVAPE